MDLILYTRVSSPGQVQDGESLTAQRERLEAWASANSHTVIARFEDAGISGATVAARPAIQDAVALACRHRGSALVVTALSRLARCTLEALQIGDRLNKAGARLISLSEAVDTSTATGKLLWTLLAAVAEWERSVNNERTIEVLDSMRRRRLRISGALPYGWALGPDGEALVPIPAEQAVLADMQRQRAEGRSYAAIAADLDARGIRTKQGRLNWLPRTVRQILLREAGITAAA
jgi:DNA invertase Pin-like site-specific DNA recombinase